MIFAPPPAPPAPGATPGLIGVTWLWEEQYDESNGLLHVVPNPENYTLLLNADGSANVQVDCNSGGGTYTVNNTELSINIMFTTMAFCGEESLDQDYLQALSRVQNYAIMNDTLFLSLEGGGSMVFVQG
jgi:heat shock protein HslJ